MGNVKGYVEYEDNRVDFDGSDAVAVVVIKGENIIVSINGELSEIGRVAMMAGADEISDEMKQGLKISDEMKQALKNLVIKDAEEPDKN